MIITQYNDYRDFLRDRFAEAKSHRREFSYQFCAKRLQTTKSYLKLVTQKARHISLEKVAAIWDLFEMTAFERQFFVILLLKNTTRDSEVAGYFDQVLTILRSRVLHSGDHVAETAESDDLVFREWLHTAIHALARTQDFVPESRWIHDRLGGEPVELRDVEQALQDLLSEQHIVEIDGQWQPHEFAFRRPNHYDPNQFMVYGIGLRKALDAIQDTKRYRPSHFHMMALAVDDATIRKIIDEYVAFRDRIIAMAKACEDPKKVIFVSNNVFSVSK